MPSTDFGFSRWDQLFSLGPTLEVQIGYDSTYRLDADSAPHIPTDRHPALVDTGSALSCIDSVLATRLNLAAVSQVADWFRAIERRSSIGAGEPALRRVVCIGYNCCAGTIWDDYG